MSIDPDRVRAVLRSRSRTRMVVRFIGAVAIQSAIGILVVLIFVWLFIIVNGALHPHIIPTITNY